MAGGLFDPFNSKVRPGVYVNMESTRQDKIATAQRGTALLPLIGHRYGPAGEFMSVTAAAPDAHKAKLGFSIYDDDPQMLLIREALRKASEVKVYIPTEGARAEVTVEPEEPDPGPDPGPDPNDNGDNTVPEEEAPEPLVIKARYGGSRGNDLIVSSAANPTGGYDVTVYLEKELVAAYAGIKSADQMAGCEWVEISGPLQAFAGARLNCGEDAQVVNSDITKFLDAAEGPLWHTLAFPLEGEDNVALQEAVASKVKYLRESVGKNVKAVLAEYAGDYEGIINVTNGVILASGAELSPAQATAWVAGADAGASYTDSNTDIRYQGAVGIVGEKYHEAAEEAIKKGEFFFSWSEQGEVVVEYDINSLTSFEKPKDETYRKNRVVRVHDTFRDTVKLNFPPNRFDNSPTGWDVVEGLGRAILKQFEDDGALKNVDYDNDFLVDRIKSTGDEMFINVGLEAVDSAEKIYFTVGTR